MTLLEKLDAISRRYPRIPTAAPSFIRHYEDADRIIGQADRFPPLGTTIAALADEMLAEQQIAARPLDHDPAFTLADTDARKSH